jgi:hypothetical protein
MHYPRTYHTPSGVGNAAVEEDGSNVAVGLRFNERYQLPHSRARKLTTQNDVIQVGMIATVVRQVGEEDKPLTLDIQKSSVSVFHTMENRH